MEIWEYFLNQLQKRIETLCYKPKNTQQLFSIITLEHGCPVTEIKKEKQSWA